MCVSAAAQVRLTPRIYDGLTYSQGETINVRVPVAGHPVPRVAWIKDGDELLTEAGRREVWLENGCAVLNISSCQRVIDRGVYGIRVENSLGVDEAAFAVEITGKDSIFVTKRLCHLLICFCWLLSTHIGLCCDILFYFSEFRNKVTAMCVLVRL